MACIVVDPVLLLGCATLAGSALALAPWAVAASSLALLLVLRRHTRSAVLAMAVVALIASGLRARSALSGAAAAYRVAVATVAPPARCIGRAEVVHSPVVRGRSTPGSDEPRGCVDLDLVDATCGDRPLDRPLRVRVYGAPEELARGDTVDAVVDVAPVQLFDNEGASDPWAPMARSGVVASGGALELVVTKRSPTLVSYIDRVRARVRARIESTFHPEAAALARALVLGESDLDPLDDDAFRNSGLAHLLAVSGTHLVLTVLTFARALRAALARTPLAARIDANRLVAVAVIPFIWIYADFAGGSGSAVRAAAMLTGVMAARAMGRRPSGVRTFGASLLAMGIADPLIGCDVSFQLSAAATAGLLLLGRRLSAYARGPTAVQAVLRAIATTVAAMVGCTPVLAMFAPGLPVLGLAANVVAAPVGELAALPLCLGHAALAWAPPIERGIATVASGALLAVRAIARVTASARMLLPLPPPSAWQLGALAVGGTSAFVAASRRRRAAVLVAAAAAYLGLEARARAAGAPRDRLRVTILDVGQGDAALVDLPDGGCMLIDGGGFVGSPIDVGERVVLPLLRARRRSRIDAVVLTHPHPDHFGGLVSALPNVDVGAFWDTGQGDVQGAGASYAAMLAALRRRGVPIVRPSALCGAPRVVGGARVEVLAPCPGIDPDASPNDNSFVLRISFGERAALLVGDAERGEEARLLRARPDALRADLLKVGHHGSRTSTSAELLAAVSPAFATVSTGVRNRFGHPNPGVLRALEGAGVTVLRTDRGGEIIWETDARAVRVDRPRAR